MSLIRQIWLLLLGTLLLAFAGGTWVSTEAARDTLQTQVRLKNADHATSLALLLSQQRGEAQTIALMMSAQFDGGHFRRIVLRAPDGGRALFEREADARPLHAPAWFVAALPIHSVPGVAQVSDGWQAIGTLEVESHTAFAHDDLWRGSTRAAGALALVGGLAALVAAVLLGRLRAPLEQTVAQARSLERGEYVRVAEPHTPELARVTRAMNSMVGRLQLVFEGQASQLDALQRQVSCDPLTGVCNRATFLARLDAALQAQGTTDGMDAAATAGGLVLLRMRDLAALNRHDGHASTDRVIVAVAQVLLSHAEQVRGAFAGRLNGSDFALVLPVAGHAGETAVALVATLRALLGTLSVRAAVVVGAVETGGAATVAGVLAIADQAVARAESRGDFAIETIGAADDALAPFARLGESAWRRCLDEALRSERGERLALAEFAVRAHAGHLLHLECPLRIRLDMSGPPVHAAHWLPLALRSGLCAELDLRAVALALAAIEADGRPRGINIAPASLVQEDFASRLVQQLEAVPRAARSLWIEVAEVAAIERAGALHDLGRRVRPLGVRLGIEHAGHALGRIERLYDLGLDYVKLDAGLGRGIGADDARASVVRGITTMLHSLSLQVIAEGVADERDAQALWNAGVDAMTGPWVSAQGG